MQERGTPGKPEYQIVDNGGVEGLTPEILSDLRDIALKFGLPKEEKFRFASDELEDLDLELLVSTSSKPDSKTLEVSKTYPFAPVIVRTTGDVVFWDPNLTSIQAKKAIEKINELTAEAGLYDPITNQRFPMPQELRRSSASQYKVEDYFKERGRVYSVIPGEDPQEILKEFDHPELLEIETNQFGAAIIYPKKDKEIVEERRRKTKDFLEEKGITTMEDLARLSFEDMGKLRKEFQRRLQKE